MVCLNRTLQDPEGNDIEVIEPPDEEKGAWAACIRVGGAAAGGAIPGAAGPGAWGEP